MKYTIYKKILCVLPATLLLLAACKKSDSNKSAVINNYNANLSAVAQNSDYTAIDVDNDAVPDFKIYAFNSTYDGFKSFETTKNAYIVSTQDSTKIVLTSSFGNYGWYRAYIFNSYSVYYPYTKGFSAGAAIGVAIPDYATAIKNTNSTIAFERAGQTVDYLASSVSPDPSNPQFTTYNESEGAFDNATQYIGFSMLKADGRHYGWIKIAVSNSNLNVQVISSGYSTVAGRSITIN